MIHKLDHVAVAVRNIDRRIDFWREALGLRAGGREAVESEGVDVAFLHAGETRIELLEPRDPDGPVGRHLVRRGEGLHHLALETSELDAVLERLRGRGVEVLGGAAREGAGGHRVAFLHPRSTGGVLVELVEATAPPPPERDDLAPGAVVLAYLREPSEKLWGVLRRIDGAGIVLEGIDIGSFDDWIAQLERGEESVIGPSVLFVPMLRVEKLLLDRPSGNLPSLAERFERRAGRPIRDVL